MNFFTENWTWKQRFVIGLWAVVAISFAFFLFSPLVALVSFSVLVSLGIATTSLSMIVAPLFLIAWFKPNLIIESTLEELIIEPTPEEPINSVDEPNEAFVFNLPASLQDNMEEIPVNQLYINHPEKKFIHKDTLIRPINNHSNESFDLRTFSLLLTTYKNLHNSAKNEQSPHIFIIGLGPTGLITALRAYANGASITGFESRTQYTRKNVFRVSDDFLVKPHDRIEFTHSIMESLFLIEQMKAINPQDAKNINNAILNKFQVNFKTVNVDSVFAHEQDGLFRTIQCNAFEALLYDLLLKLQHEDQESIRLYRGGAISQIEAEKGLVTINEDTVIKANWIVNATGTNGRLTSNVSIIEALFPYKQGERQYDAKSPSACYLAATLLINGNSYGRRGIVSSTLRTVPHSFLHGAQQLQREQPLIENQINSILTDYQTNSNYTRHDTLAEQRVIYGYVSKEDYLNISKTHMINRTRDSNTAEIDLACSYNAVIDGLEKAKALGWQRNRLPLIRLLTTDATTYVGMELSTELFNQMTSDTISDEQKEALFIGWIKIALEQFFPQSLIEKISVEQGSAFTFQIRICNKIMHTYPSGTQVFNLGDSLAPPHFLTGAGLESAAISVDRWINYLQKSVNQEQYIEHIKIDVQEANANKVNTGLGQLNMFSEHRQPLQARSQKRAGIADSLSAIPAIKKSLAK